MNEVEAAGEGGGNRRKGQEFATGISPDRLVGRHVFCALDSFGSDLERPGQNQGHRKSEDEQENHDPDRPVGNIEERKNLSGNLDEDPADDGISDGNAIDIAPLQFAQEPAPVHQPPF